MKNGQHPEQERGYGQDHDVLFDLFGFFAGSLFFFAGAFSTSIVQTSLGASSSVLRAASVKICSIPCLAFRLITSLT
jgi:hypothetical protein